MPSLRGTPFPRAAGQLQAKIIASRTSGTAPLAIFFEGTESTDADGNKIGHPDTGGGQGLLGNDIVEYTWDFGDGSPEFKGFNAAHVHEAAGTYVVEVKIRDLAGSEDTKSEPIDVRAFEDDTYCFSNTQDFYGCLIPLSRTRTIARRIGNMKYGM